MSVTLSEWCALLQTGATIVTGGIVWWYTVETKKLRLIAQKQAEATDAQMALATSQFALAKTESEQRQKDAAALWRLNRQAADPISIMANGRVTAEGTLTAPFKMMVAEYSISWSTPPR